MSSEGNVRFKPKPSIIWVKGMKLGRGAGIEPLYVSRIKKATRVHGAGTIEDPKLTWLSPGPSPKELGDAPAIDAIVRQQARECTLSYAWIASSAHGTSTTGWKHSDRIASIDDLHITVRFGSSEDTCNLHGHIYLVYEDNDPAKGVVRMMKEEERGIKGGRSPQLWVWGNYPPESPAWPRARVGIPKLPHEIIQGSILDIQERKREISSRF
ncbi:hypothetical protein F5Y04DRAFT_291448 [Hypomontagnella monticulosa]|nr:hypothetical protein F5Y04DRAFT_291448 [Hypomontagnella monticulosa]